MTADEFTDVMLFRERVEKLAASQRKHPLIPISNTALDSELNVISFEANTPDVDDVMNLALKFRFFYADKEPTQFRKVLTKVRRRVHDEWACGYIDWLDNQYKDSMKEQRISAALGLPVSNRTIIDLWFNSEFFHSEPSKRKELVNIHAVIGEGPSLFQLYVAIVRCSSYIQMLYSVVHCLCLEHSFIYSPNHHFGRRVAAERSNV